MKSAYNVLNADVQQSVKRDLLNSAPRIMLLQFFVFKRCSLFFELSKLYIFLNDLEVLHRSADDALNVSLEQILECALPKGTV